MKKKTVCIQLTRYKPESFGWLTGVGFTFLSLSLSAYNEISHKRLQFAQSAIDQFERRFAASETHNAAKQYFILLPYQILFNIKLQHFYRRYNIGLLGVPCHDAHFSMAKQFHEKRLLHRVRMMWIHIHGLLLNWRLKPVFPRWIIRLKCGCSTLKRFFSQIPFRHINLLKLNHNWLNS